MDFETEVGRANEKVRNVLIKKQPTTVLFYVNEIQQSLATTEFLHSFI